MLILQWIWAIQESVKYIWFLFVKQKVTLKSELKNVPENLSLKIDLDPLRK